MYIAANLPNSSDSNLLIPSNSKPLTEQTPKELFMNELFTTLKCDFHITIAHSQCQELMNSEKDLSLIENELVCSDTELTKLLYEELEINDNYDSGSCSVDFQLEKLCSQTETTYQEYLSSLSTLPNVHITDTHSTPDKNTCVAPMKGDTINFNAKPNGSNEILPEFLEVKSRLAQNISTDLIQESIANESLQNTEWDLLQQMLSRIRSQSLFRHHLRKLIVLGSTGFFSWCFVVRQHFTRDEKYCRLFILRISNDEVNTIWRRTTNASMENTNFYLSNQGRYIIATLRQLTDIHIGMIRVQRVSISRATVYYISLPSKENTIYRKNKTYAFKVITTRDNFENEAHILSTLNQETYLEAIKYIFTPRKPHYFLGYYDLETNCLKSNKLPKVRRTSRIIRTNKWSNPIVNFRDGDGGVIIMEPALKYQPEIINLTGQLQLEENMRNIHHRNIVHRDLRPTNFLFFGDKLGWQIVDFDLATNFSIDNTVNTWINPNSELLQYCSGKIRNAFRLSKVKESVGVNWDKYDDMEMLSFSIQKKNGILCKINVITSSKL